MKIEAIEFKNDESFAGIIIGGQDVGEGLKHVVVTYEDGREEELFSFYTDELVFSPQEFVGLTKEQALDLFRRRDIEYLQS
jgi:hypothetical protein